MSMRPLKINVSITNRESYSLEKYLLEINKLPLITPQEEERLALLIKQGNEEAFDQLIKANLRFVVSVAKQYQHMGLSLADLINEGNIGLMQAARNFDATRGFKFISYAVWWIRQQIIKSLADDARLVRLPLNKINLQHRIQKVNTMLEQQLQRPASVDELAEHMGLHPDSINETYYSGEKHISLDSPIDADEEGNMMDMLVNENADPADKKIAHTASLKVEVARALQVLNTQQKKTICYYFGLTTGDPMNLEQIAELFHLTRERVRQIMSMAIEKLRNSDTAGSLKTYLGS